MSARPLVIDGFCGLGGWAEGFLAENYDVVGFDTVRHDYGSGGYPGQLVLQDWLTLDGRQFRNASCIVASPPCQEFSYMAMPWSRGKQIAAALRGEILDFPDKYTGSRTLTELTALFDACFRIQREACEASGRYIPLIVENVKGAQPWVGPAKANFGSFYLWGDVESVGGAIVGRRPRFGETLRAKRAIKNGGGSWFAIGSPGQENVGQNPDGRKLPGNNGPRLWADREVQRLCDAPIEGAKNDGSGWLENGTLASCNRMVPDGQKVPGMSGWDGYGKPGYKPQGFNVTAAQRYREGQKGFTTGLGKGHDWRQDPSGRFNSKSDSRKAASAQIAKIPFPLAQHIARIYKP